MPPALQPHFLAHEPLQPRLARDARVRRRVDHDEGQGLPRILRSLEDAAHVVADVVARQSEGRGISKQPLVLCANHSHRRVCSTRVDSAKDGEGEELPAEPKTPSVSRNGEPYESRVALNGVAQHSCAQPHFLRTCVEIKISRRVHAIDATPSTRRVDFHTAEDVKDLRRDRAVLARFSREIVIPQ